MVLLAWLAAQADAKPETTWTAEALVAKNAAARGGAAKLQAISTVRWTGKLLVNGGAQAYDWSELQSRPGQIRQETTIQGMTQVFAWDGHDAWQVNPFRGRKDPERVPGDDAKGLVESAPIEGPLLDAKAKGWPIRYVGTEDVDGTLAHELEIDRPDGDVQLVYLDPDYFLEIRMVTRQTVHGVVQEGQVDYGDYEKVADVYFPLLLAFGPKDGADTDRVKIQIEKGEPNVAVDAATFRFPGGE